MLSLIMHRARGLRFYRVEVSDTLFGEYLVEREWGRMGRASGTRRTWFSNLREAAQAADRWRHRAQNRGYALTERRYAK
ncbi:WGR domain-containing protein [Pseudothioclava nitratireducens]|jgi:predicted DNA-binding WGR domain protein|uniref:WGR domain-containing protein n=1 Tax=Pseudothioclava nitratireducens TaxID=1928646 RepID=UPI0023DA83E1|nr:WGR domain-containing protein [Defluviimonas nitratireducens]MDF1620316.1 WGR domain-containing protein [Defluviimonas nitratireducens]